LFDFPQLLDILLDRRASYCMSLHAVELHFMLRMQHSSEAANQP